MKNLWALASAASVVLFASGVFVGREFPRHHFQPLRENSSFLLDTSTGRLCFLKLPNTNIVYTTNIMDQAVLSSQGKTPVNFPPCEK
jgi:hypothetical protein